MAPRLVSLGRQTSDARTSSLSIRGARLVGVERPAKAPTKERACIAIRVDSKIETVIDKRKCAPLEDHVRPVERAESIIASASAEVMGLGNKPLEENIARKKPQPSKSSALDILAAELNSAPLDAQGTFEMAEVSTPSAIDILTAELRFALIEGQVASEAPELPIPAAASCASDELDLLFAELDVCDVKESTMRPSSQERLRPSYTVPAASRHNRPSSVKNWRVPRSSFATTTSSNIVDYGNLSPLDVGEPSRRTVCASGPANKTEEIAEGGDLPGSADASDTVENCLLEALKLGHSARRPSRRKPAVAWEVRENEIAVLEVQGNLGFEAGVMDNNADSKRRVRFAAPHAYDTTMPLDSEWDGVPATYDRNMYTDSWTDGFGLDLSLLPSPTNQGKFNAAVGDMWNAVGLTHTRNL